MFRRIINTAIASLSLAAALLTLPSSARATAVWANGQVITYTQEDWGVPVTTAGSILSTNYISVYAPAGLFEIGIPGPAGFSLLFTGASTLSAYLPATGPAAALNADLLDPTFSASGSFGGEIAGLKLNIDFANAGLILGTSGIAFGDLILTNFNTLPLLNGLTVRQFFADADIWLGGGTSIYSISELATVAQNLNSSFDTGIASTYANDHLVAPTSSVSQVPEPSTLLLLLPGLTGLFLMRGRIQDLEFQKRRLHSGFREQSR